MSHKRHLEQSKGSNSVDAERALNEMYQHFMVGYVRRINEATLNVTIGGVRIGSAKYTRLAQINLKSRIITFSRHAIENVPERGRRYLVLHELSHVNEASHNKHFWSYVERYEPHYRQIGKELEVAFRKNVRDDQLLQAGNNATINSSTSSKGEKLEQLKVIATPRLMGVHANKEKNILLPPAPGNFDDDDETFECLEKDFGLFDGQSAGIVQGGSEFDETEFSDFD
ncbi:MAG: M48 family metallopeptidase [Leptolyngbya sp.]|nr:M48 family metallopeptidase [Candidatus Melainabacteria bacterium]